MPARPTANSIKEEAPPVQPVRRLPPPAARSALSMGFNHAKSAETPNAAQPPPTYNRPSGPVVQELNANNFDQIILSGKFALVDFYAPYCKYCVELDPHYKQLAEDFAFASDRIVIAKVDVDAHKSFLTRYGIEGYPTILFFDGKGDNPEKYPWMRETDAMTEFLKEKTGISPSDAPKAGGIPPPINLSSKPSMAQVKAVSATSTIKSSSSSSSGCLLCRDFSGPDHIASQYPRESLPRSHDNTGYLADVLCRPFSSATDKARAIFVWLHHNIAYDVDAFFGNRVKNVSPADTIQSGLAVCGGYAGLFTAIALKAGLEAIMVTGHGKGYGYSPLKPGESCPPPNPGGHAWNAVRIDGGEWKLIDPCWGAGNVGNQVYNKRFKPSEFTKSNEDFGIRHFPADRAHFFRSDGRIPTWEEYYIGEIGGESLKIFSSADDHGVSTTSFSPPRKHITAAASHSEEVMRFQFSKTCTHWDFEKNGQGKPYCMVLKVGGVDGRKEDMIPFEFDGFWWWVDVRVKELGCKGQTVSLFAVTEVDGRAARGMSREVWLGKKGRCGMAFGGVAEWELV
jgi:protein disulfide-isomerase-like protein